MRFTPLPRPIAWMSWSSQIEARIASGRPSRCRSRVRVTVLPSFALTVAISTLYQPPAAPISGTTSPVMAAVMAETVAGGGKVWPTTMRRLT